MSALETSWGKRDALKTYNVRRWGIKYFDVNNQGNVTVAHQDSADTYTVVATVDSFRGAKTICVDAKTHTAYLFQPERGPAPAAPADAPPPAAGQRGRGPQGPIVASWFIKITH